MIKGDAAPDNPSGEESAWVPSGLIGFEASYASLTSIPHYYGTIVRQLLLGAAALVLFASPLYADSIQTEFPFEVVGVFFAVLVAALTNPRNRYTLMADAIVSGVGMIVYAGWGLLEYQTISPVAFILRLAIAVICLFAFYFSLKTVRAFALNSIGKLDTLTDLNEGEIEEIEREDREELEARKRSSAM
jgi:hypothetical protein